jgi:hypothetical protein
MSAARDSVGAMLRRGAILASLGVFSLVLSACAAAEPAQVPATERDLEDYYAQDVWWGECDSDWLIDEEVSTLRDSELTCSTVLVPAVYDDSSDAPI